MSNIVDRLAMSVSEWSSVGFFKAGMKNEDYEVLGQDRMEEAWIKRREEIINEPRDAEAPEWAKWKAQDSDGDWYWYGSKPWKECYDDSWIGEVPYIKFASEGGFPNGHSWDKTLKTVIRKSNGILDEMKFFHIPDREGGRDTEWGNLPMPEEMTLNLKELYDSLGREANGDGTINLEDIIIHATVRNYGEDEYYPMTSVLSYRGIDYAVQHGESFSVLKFKREVEGTSKSSGMNVVKIKSPIAFPALVEGMRQYNTSNSHSLEDYIEGWMDSKGIKWYSITLGEQKV